MKTPMSSREEGAPTRSLPSPARSRSALALPQVLGVLGLVAGAPISAAFAQPVETGQLVGVHSGACLGRTGGPAALDCRHAPVISLVHLPGNPNRVMVRDDSANTCLFSNRDGRFGLYGCVAEYGDQFWRIEEPAGLRRERRRERPVEVVPVLEPPPPLPLPPPLVAPVHRPRPVRDCGTGDDPGCQELRDGFQAMGADVWAGFYANLRATASDLRKRDLVVTLAGSNYLTARQLVQALELFRSELLQIEVTRAVAGHVVDPQRALEFGARMRSGISRQQYIEILTASLPPAQRPGMRPR